MILALHAESLSRRALLIPLTSSSGQAYAPEKLFKTLIGAIAVKDRIDGEVSHPNGVIVYRRLAAI